MEDNRNQSGQSADQLISTEIIPHPSIGIGFKDAQSVILHWASVKLPERDNRDISDAKLYATRSGISERRILPARIEYYPFGNQFYLEYDVTAHERLMDQLVVDDTTEQLRLSSLIMGAEMVRQLFDRRRTQPTKEWNKMQKAIKSLEADWNQIYQDLESNAPNLDDSAFLDEVWHDLENAPEERIQRINTIRLLLGVARQAFTEETVPTYWNYATQSIDEALKSFWRGLEHETMERKLLREKGMEIEGPLSDYMIAGCAPMSEGHINTVISELC